jgi:hypothetical protein
LQVEQLEDRRLLSGGFRFTSLATIPGPAPGGGQLVNDFEPGGLNNRGEVAFVADVTASGEEGVFLGREGRITQIARSGQPAPGGGTFNADILPLLGVAPGAVNLVDSNDQGDVSFGFFLSPVGLPLGVNAGVYRYSHSTQTVIPVVVPGVTPAPGGGMFAGTSYAFGLTNLNNRGDLVFPGIVPGADIAPGPPGVDGLGLGVGLFLADPQGHIASVVRPGDPAPGGGTFDFASNAWINDRGDIAFDAHQADDECFNFGVPQDIGLACLPTGVYLKGAATGAIQAIAHQGDPAPGGGVYRFLQLPVMNNRDDIVFYGDLTPAGQSPLQTVGVFLHSEGGTIAVARPSDPLPGGGHVVTVIPAAHSDYVNNRGVVTFDAQLDTDANHDGVPDTGLYEWSRGTLSLVARTGTIIPGMGTIAQINALGSGILNDRGQVLFQATLTDGRIVLLIATPQGGGCTGAAMRAY